MLLHYELQRLLHLAFCVEYFVTFCFNFTAFSICVTFCNAIGLILPLLRIEKSHCNMHFFFFCPVIDHEFRHNIVKVAVDYFDNVMTKFTV